MKVEPFLMERWQSVYEHQVAHNLSESGVHPLTVKELLAIGGGTSDEERPWLETPLGYAQGNGEEALRLKVAALYPGAGADNILITHGGAEANFLATLRILAPGDEAVVMLPNYMQIPGLIAPWGATSIPWRLDGERGWAADIDLLREQVNEKTRLIVITNPNNPTGRAFGEDLLDAIVGEADRVGAWILSDEIYRGSEISGVETPSFWGRYDKLLITSGLSKAYGLPGLRTGWAASPDRSLVEHLWSYHDYSTICSSPLTQALAAHALHKERRIAILERTRGIIRSNLPVITSWADAQGGRFEYTPPDAGAILWLKYSDPVNSTRLAEDVRLRGNTLVVPGDHFGMDHYIRLGFGSDSHELTKGLAEVRRAFDSQ